MAALGIVAVVLFIYIIQNPSTYRQASARLTVVAAFLRKNEAALETLPPADLQTRIEQVVAVVSTILVLGVSLFAGGCTIVEGGIAYAVAGAVMWFIARKTF